MSSAASSRDRTRKDVLEMRPFVFVFAIVAMATLLGCGGAAPTITPRKPTVTPIRQPSPVATATAVRTLPPTPSAVAALPSATASPSVPAPAATRSPSVATPPATPIGTPAPVGGSRNPVVKTGPVAPPVSLLMAVRAARHENYDRVVFEFAGQLPEYRVQYPHPPLQQAAS